MCCRVQHGPIQGPDHQLETAAPAAMPDGHTGVLPGAHGDNDHPDGLHGPHVKLEADAQSSVQTGPQNPPPVDQTEVLRDASMPPWAPQGAPSPGILGLDAFHSRLALTHLQALYVSRDVFLHDEYVEGHGYQLHYNLFFKSSSKGSMIAKAVMKNRFALVQ